MGSNRPSKFARDVERGLIAAAKAARKVAIKHNTPIYVSRRGKVVALDPKTGNPLRSKLEPSADELNSIATQMVNAPTAPEAEKLKQRYLAGFYGLPRELTIQEAANILNVSRPFVVQLIKTKRLPARKVGTRRRILVADLMTYKEKADADRNAALDELAQQAQELKLGYREGDSNPRSMAGRQIPRR